MKDNRIMGDASGRLVVFCRELAKAREEQHIYQEWLAWQLGVSRSYLSQVESGKKRPTLKFLDRWAEELGFELVFELNKKHTGNVD